MRKLITCLVVAVAAVSLSSNVNATELRPGENPGVVYLKPTAGNQIGIYAVEETGVDPVSVTGVRLRATLGDGEGGEPDPVFTDFTFGETTTADLQAIFDPSIPSDDPNRFQPAVHWFPENGNADAAEFPINKQDGLFNSATALVGEVTWWEPGRSTSLPTGAAPTLVAQVVIDASGFSSTTTAPTSFPLTLEGASQPFGDSEWIGPMGVAMAANVSNTTLVVTLLGDATLDGAVALGDLGVVLDNLGAGPSDWEQGDFDGNGVALGDLGAVLDNLGGSVAPSPSPSSAPGPGVTAVPEPTTLAILAFGGLALLRRRAGLDVQ